MRTSPLIARLALAVALVAALATGTCGDDGGEASAGAALADRWLRVGEELGTGVQVYDGALPPHFAELLNEGASSADEPDQIALPVHPDGTLLGSFHLRRPDASNLIWLIFDVPGGDAAVHDTVAAQLDESPWQVVGGQSSAALSVVRFQSTRTGNIDGTAVIQPLPSTSQFSIGIERDASARTLELTRSAPVPVLEADLVERNGGVIVRRVDGGAAAAAGLAADDRITSVGGEPVTTIADVDRALRSLVSAGDAAVSLVYILELGASQPPRETTFVLPDSRALPDGFPAPFLVDADMTVLDVSWASQGGQGSAYQATLVSGTDASTLAAKMRDAIDEAGWLITGDQAVGFATQLDFASADGAIAGRAQIDSFDQDPALTSVALQLQRSGSGG